MSPLGFRVRGVSQAGEDAVSHAGSHAGAGESDLGCWSFGLLEENMEG